jgi:hypothetical protein
MPSKQASKPAAVTQPETRLVAEVKTIGSPTATEELRVTKDGSYIIKNREGRIRPASLRGAFEWCTRGEEANETSGTYFWQAEPLLELYRRVVAALRKAEKGGAR